MQRFTAYLIQRTVTFVSEDCLLSCKEKMQISLQMIKDELVSRKNSMAQQQRMRSPNRDQDEDIVLDDEFEQETSQLDGSIIGSDDDNDQQLNQSHYFTGRDRDEYLNQTMYVPSSAAEQMDHLKVEMLDRSQAMKMKRPSSR